MIKSLLQLLRFLPETLTCGLIGGELHFAPRGRDGLVRHSQRRVVHALGIKTTAVVWIELERTPPGPFGRRQIVILSQGDQRRDCVCVWKFRVNGQRSASGFLRLW